MKSKVTCSPRAVHTQERPQAAGRARVASLPLWTGKPPSRPRGAAASWEGRGGSEGGRGEVREHTRGPSSLCPLGYPHEPRSPSLPASALPSCPHRRPVMELLCLPSLSPPDLLASPSPVTQEPPAPSKVSDRCLADASHPPRPSPAPTPNAVSPSHFLCQGKVPPFRQRPGSSQVPGRAPALTPKYTAAPLPRRSCLQASPPGSAGRPLTGLPNVSPAPSPAEPPPSSC